MIDNDRYIEAPNEGSVLAPSLFIAGSITGCPDWQTPTCQEILDRTSKLQTFNPRQANFPIHDPDHLGIRTSS